MITEAQQTDAVDGGEVRRQDAGGPLILRARAVRGGRGSLILLFMNVQCNRLFMNVQCRCSRCAAQACASLPCLSGTQGGPHLQVRLHYGGQARNEIAAIKQLVSTGDAMSWLLCYFHFLQEWERFLRSAESGVVGKEAQHRVLRSLAHLVHVQSERMFKEKVGANSWPAAQHLHWILTLTLPCFTHPRQLSAWYCNHVPYPAVVRKMLDHWQGCAEHWAWWGRLDVLDLGANTNNLVERFFGLLKYVHLERSTQHTLQRLVNVLLERVVPAAMQRGREALAGRGVASDQQQREQRQRKYVQELAASGAVSAAPPGSAPGLTSVRTSEEHVTTTCWVT